MSFTLFFGDSPLPARITSNLVTSRRITVYRIDELDVMLPGRYIAALVIETVLIDGLPVVVRGALVFVCRGCSAYWCSMGRVPTYDNLRAMTVITMIHMFMCPETWSAFDTLWQTAIFPRAEIGA